MAARVDVVVRACVGEPFLNREDVGKEYDDPCGDQYAAPLHVTEVIAGDIDPANEEIVIPTGFAAPEADTGDEYVFFLLDQEKERERPGHDSDTTSGTGPVVAPTHSIISTQGVMAENEDGTILLVRSEKFTMFQQAATIPWDDLPQVVEDARS
ncbi:hypothetical protein [Brevibacterium litoralis]|uniref:hypothetical protein n=1 Tax=Brevibacterium litoralis TaxID=3138935 RepID=UPI0032EF7885